MRIAILEPYIEGIGGAQKLIAQYAQYLKSKGHNVEIFTQRYNSKTCYSEFYGLKINLLKPRWKFLVPWVFLLKKFYDFDLVIANDWPTHFSSFRNDNVVWICYSPKRDFYDLKSFYLESGGYKKRISIFLKELVFKKIDRFCAKSSKMILPISKTISLRVRDYYGLIAKNIFYPGVNFSEFHNGKMKDYFLSVGRLVKTKRTEAIVKAINLVKNKNIKLIVIGDGVEEESLKELARGNNQITFLGAVSDKEKRNLYSNAISLVYVPASEDWGLTPIEAAACKVPTIGVSEGGLKETIIDKKTGFLLSCADPKLIAEKMDYLFNNRAIARKMGINAYNNCKVFDLHKMLSILGRWLIIASKI